MNSVAVESALPAGDSSSGEWRAWVRIPQLAARLLWNHWPQLLFWFFAQRVSYYLGMKLAVALALQSPLLGYVGIALLVLVQLVTTAMMFIAVKPSLPAVSSAREGDWLPPMQPWSNSLGAALLPFFAFYVTWGLLENVKRDFGASFFDHDLAAALNQALQSKGTGEAAPDYVNWRNVMGLPGLWIALLVSAVVRYFAKLRAASTQRLGWMLLATLCEAYWVFIGVTAIASVTGDVKQAWHETRAWVAVAAWWENPVVFRVSLDGAKQFVLAPVLAFVRTVAGAVLLPLVWLAITAIIYGLDLRRRHRIDAADKRLGGLAARYQRSNFLVRNVAGKLSGGWVSKGVPVLNSIRLVLRAGLPALVTLCLGWELLTFVDAWGWRAVVSLIGPMDYDAWRAVATPAGMLVGDPTSVQPTLLVQVLRTVLLAATFDRAIARLGAAQRPPGSAMSR
ncbi:hypothetical protein ACTJIL_14170 [Luteimonas sp. 22616]|uniref:hypothetical protein n=1 Tax=Luteimonas sp. 22616 TaxID=3453951 RepID=UPI003F86B2B4